MAIPKNGVKKHMCKKMFKLIVLLFLCSSTIFAKQSVIIDTDVGYDDLMAIMSLVHKAEIDVQAITISGTGLAHPKQGLDNVRLLLAILNKNIPTAYGCEQPFEGGHLFPEDWRRNIDAISEKMKDFAIENTNRSNTCALNENNAVELLAATIQASPQNVTFLALAPLTNLAELFLRYPHLIQKVEKIYIMGGAFHVPGNLSIVKDSVAEWNIFADPAAARAVLQTGIPIYFIPLDATNHVPLTIPFYEKVSKMHSGTQKVALFLSLLSGVLPWVNLDGFYFWDMVAAEILADPSLADFERHKIDIATTPGLHCGKTFFSENGIPVQIAIKVDAPKLLQAYCDTIDLLRN